MDMNIAMIVIIMIIVMNVLILIKMIMVKKNEEKLLIYEYLHFVDIQKFYLYI